MRNVYPITPMPRLGYTLPNNSLPPRSDKGRAYAFDRKGTRTIVD